MAKLLVAPSMGTRAISRNLKIPSWHTVTRYAFAHDWSPSQKKQKRVTPGRRPIGSLNLFPSTDPYTSTQRAEFRAVMQNVSWVSRSNRMMMRLVTGQGYTTEIEPRVNEDQELKDDALEKWANETKFVIPYESGEEWTAKKILQFVNQLSSTLDLESVVSRAYLYMREQGEGGIMMLPEMPGEDEETGQEIGFVMPEVLRTIRPEHAMKIWLNFETGEMDSLQVIGIQSNGGKLDAERLIWLTTDMNLDLNTDFHGESKILPILDAAKTMGILYAKDYPEAAQYTWHQPKIFQVDIPARDYKQVDQVLKAFLNKANNSQGRDIAVTQSVELLNSNSNTGDLAGLINLDNQLIEQVAGFYNIPPFLLSKGKAGNLGGNAQKEEVDGFLNFEVKPEQEIIEVHLENQYYDRILKILFQADSLEEIPVKIRHNFVKPDIETLFNKEQYEVLLDMLSKGIISEDGLIERMGTENLQKGTISRGADTDPTKNVWNRKNAWRGNKINNNWAVDTGWQKPEDLKPAWNDTPQIKWATAVQPTVSNKQTES